MRCRFADGIRLRACHTPASDASVTETLSMDVFNPKKLPQVGVAGNKPIGFQEELRTMWTKGDTAKIQAFDTNKNSIITCTQQSTF